MISAANLTLRFLLELATLAGLACWAWNLSSGLWRYVFAILAVVTAMFVWGVFAVPNDPSRSGRALVPVPGLLRLTLELCILLGGAAAWYLSGFTVVAAIIGLLIVLHYVLAAKRIAWLLEQ